MAESRRSRRLRGLTADENPLGVCLICQREIEVHLLGRCKLTPCCGVYLHKSCYQDMVAFSASCGNCRRPNEDRTMVLETDEELTASDDENDPFVMHGGIEHYPHINHFQLLVSYEIDGYRRSGRPLFTHEPGSLYWNDLPFLFSPCPFYDYYNELESFVNVYPGETMFVHGLVKIPVPVTREVREIIYKCFIYNTPNAVLELIATHRIRFRFLFFYQENRSDIELSNLAVFTHGGGPSFYNEDLYRFT